MAHLLENDKSMVYVGDRPWHGLGVYLGDQANATLDSVVEALPTAGSNIVFKPALVGMPDGSLSEVPGEFVAMRELDSKILAIVGDQARQANMSPRRALAAFDKMFGEGKACVHTAGFLRDGKVFWVAGKAGAPITVEGKGGKDTVEKYFMLVTSFDGSLATNMLLSPVRPVCNNTVTLALQDNVGRTKIKHTRSHEARLVEAEERWTQVLAEYENFARRIQIYAATALPDIKAQEIFRTAFGVTPQTIDAEISTRTKNNLDLVNSLYNGGRGNGPWTGTAWGAFNALTEYADHNMVVRGVRDSEGNLAADGDKSRILDSVLFGNAADFKLGAMKAVDKVIASL